jgi:hypothetical protein
VNQIVIVIMIIGGNSNNIKIKNNE